MAAHAAELLRPTGQAVPEEFPFLLVDSKTALAWFEAERPTLLTAVRQAAEQDLLEVAAELVMALVVYFPIHARWLDLEKTSELLLGAARRTQNQRIEAVALDDLGLAWREQRHLDEAVEHYKRSLAIFQQLDDCGGRARVLHHLGAVHRDKGEIKEARQMFEQSLQIAREANDQSVEARALDGLGLVYQLEENYRQAIICFERSVAIRRALGDRYGEGFALLGLGEARLQAGDLEAAKPLLDQALTIFDELGTPWTQNVRALLQSLDQRAKQR